MKRIKGTVLLLAWLTGAVVLPGGCDRADRPAGIEGKTSAPERATRRAYDGAPPTIPHAPSFGGSCRSCHTESGLELPGVGFAPAVPHGEDASFNRCRACHVYRQTEEVFRENSFEGLAQDLRKGPRAHPLAPPMMPHASLLRENCKACHTGVSAREEIRCDHPERGPCQTCHLEIRTTESFSRGVGLVGKDSR